MSDRKSPEPITRPQDLHKDLKPIVDDCIKDMARKFAAHQGVTEETQREMLAYATEQIEHRMDYYSAVTAPVIRQRGAILQNEFGFNDREGAVDFLEAAAAQLGDFFAVFNEHLGRTWGEDSISMGSHAIPSRWWHPAPQHHPATVTVLHELEATLGKGFDTQTGDLNNSTCILRGLENLAEKLKDGSL